jgi:YHS domain-containing protein
MNVSSTRLSQHGGTGPAKRRARIYLWIIPPGRTAFLVAALAAAILPGCKRKAEVAQQLKENPGAQISSSSENFKLKPHPPSGSEETFTDPFCGMKLRKSEAAGTFEYKGVTYYFCTMDHLKAFKEDPEKYLNIDIDGDDPL